MITAIWTKLQQFASWSQEFANRRPTSFACFWGPVVYLVMAMVFRPSYETNDDAVMNLIAAGQGVVTSPDEHLVFTSPLIGLVLKQLYSSLPKFPWYGFYLLATQAVAHTLILRWLLIRGWNLQTMSIYWLWMLIPGVHFLTHLQFTSTSFLIGVAGFMWTWQVVADYWKVQRIQWSVLALGASCIWFACLIRWYTFDLLMILSVIGIGTWLLMNRAPWRVWGVTATLGILICCVGLGLRWQHVNYYHAQPEWSDFFVYNELRAKFNDNMSIGYNSQTIPHFEQAGWTANDITMMFTWGYDDPRVYSAEKLRMIADPVERIPTPWSWQFLLQRLAPLQQWDSQLWPLLLGFALSLGWAVVRQRCLFWMALVNLLLTGGLILMIAVLRKAPPPRVLYPIAIWPSLFLMCASQLGQFRVPKLNPLRQMKLPGFEQVWFQPHHFQRLKLISILVTVILGSRAIFADLRSHHHIARQHAHRSSEFRTAMSQLGARPDQLYIFWGAEVPIERIQPLDHLQWMSPFRIALLGWVQQTPHHQRMLSTFGMRSVLQDIAKHPDVKLICHEQCVPILANYIKQHDDQELAWRINGNLLTSPIFQLQYQALSNQVLPADSATQLAREPEESEQR